MTEQEMLAKIAELEEQIQLLTPPKKKYKVSLLSAFGEEYPFVRTVKMYGEGLACLSKLIRLSCFQTIEGEKLQHYKYHPDSTRKVKTDNLLRTENMTDEQKQMFVEIAGQILEVLSNYEILTKEEK